MESIEIWRERYYTDRESCFAQIQEKEDRWGLFLALYLRLAEDTREQYRRLGIDEKIFRDTMTDLDIWRENCRKQHGVDGLAEYRWLTRHLELKLFRLGRLQFEPIGWEKKAALNVHIPQGEPLDPDAVRQSYRQAYSFFHGSISCYVCGSWLLLPQLGQILPLESNIMQFQKDYTVTKLITDFRQCEERVFPQVLDDPSGYPESTRLQRGVKQLLLSGEKLGFAMGEMEYHPEF